MKRFSLPFIALLLVVPLAQAERWIFIDRIEIPANAGTGVFHHLEGAGRKHIAVSEGTVGITWEDNSPGAPQVFVSVLDSSAGTFNKPLQVSNGAEAFEPAVAALDEQSFILAWEQDSSVHAAIVNSGGVVMRGKLSNNAAGHASVAAHERRVAISWREQSSAGWFIKLVTFEVDENLDFENLQPVPVEREPVVKPMQMPSVAVGPAGIGIAWEDRREGHTRMLYSHSADGEQWLPPDSLNEFFSGRTEYDKGNGSTRVSIAGFAEDEIVSAWMDKRRGGGWGIFASLGSEGGASYGPNEKVHGPIGDREPHYNPSTAGNVAGDFAVAWDDYRNGDSDVWISYYDDFDEWGDDLGPAIAGGAGEQTHPSIYLDENGDLHLLWLEKADLFAPSRLWYSLGQRRVDQ